MGRMLLRLHGMVRRRGTRYGLNTALALMLFLAIVVGVEALAIRHNVRVDLTEGRRHSLSDQSIKLLRSLENEVHAGPCCPAGVNHSGVVMGKVILVYRLSRAFGVAYLLPVVTQYEPHPITQDFTLASFFPFARTADAAKELPAGVTVPVLG